MTWRSHTLANGAVAMALTGRPALAVGAMLAAALPDKLEKWLPFARHRGLSHWLVLWAAVAVGVAVAVGGAGPLLGSEHGVFPRWGTVVRQVALGVALGPLLHVVLDGFSAAGVPLGPFCRQRLKLGFYRTSQTRRFSLDVSEVLFVAVLLVVCFAAWRLAWVR